MRAAPRADVGFTEQLNPVERPPFAFAAGNDQAAVQRADSQQLIYPLPDLNLVQCGERAHGGFERQAAFARGQPHAVTARVSLVVT